MYVTQTLYVGAGPEGDDAAMEMTRFGKRVVRVATAQQAKVVIDAGMGIAVVPTTDIAKDTLILLGASPAWSRLAVYESVNPDIARTVGSPF